MWEKKGENPKNMVDDLKRSSEIFALKMDIFFPKKRFIQKSWSAKKFPSPKFGARSPPLMTEVLY